MATYTKGLARKASLTEGSTRAAKSYKAEVASLTSKRAGLRAQIRDMTEEHVKHRSDLKHASTTRVRAEDKEKKSRKDVKVAEDELWLAREELQAVKGDLCAKVTKLDRVHQEALEVGSSVESLTEELSKFRMDLDKQEALANRRGEVIAELRDEACTQWASGWLTFQRRTSKAFPDLEFNIQLSDEEVEESASKAEADAGVGVLSGALDRAPLPDDLRVPPEASSFALPAGALPFDPPDSVNRGPTSSA